MSIVLAIRSGRAVLALSLSCAASGCVYGELTQVIRTDVAAENNCPETTVQELGLPYLDDDPESNSYKVESCGTVQTYTCPQDPGMVRHGDSSELCSVVQGNAAAPKATKMDDSSILDDEVPSDAPAATAEPEAEPPVSEEPEPAAAEPEAVEPEAAEPEATEPEAAKPEAAEPEAAEPEAEAPKAE